VDVIKNVTKVVTRAETRLFYCRILYMLVAPDVAYDFNSADGIRSKQLWCGGRCRNIYYVTCIPYLVTGGCCSYVQCSAMSWSSPVEHNVWWPVMWIFRWERHKCSLEDSSGDRRWCGHYNNMAIKAVARWMDVNGLILSVGISETDLQKDVHWVITRII